MTIVSNSDIETAQKCERMFYYARVMRLRPRELSVWLKRGTFGHLCMETGFQVILDGGSVDDAIQAIGLGPLQDLLNSGDPDTSEMAKVYRHVSAFITFSQSEGVNWRPVALEDTGMWNLSQNTDFTKVEGQATEDTIFAYTPDLIIEFTHGLLKGQHAVLDYKFLGQYMSEVAVNMAQQIPKYILYRNKHHTDYKIRRGAFVQLNTRAGASDTGHKLFLIKWVEPNKQRLERIEYENSVMVERVAALHEKKPEEFIRTVNKDVCDKCFFARDLCPAEFDGRSQETIQKIIDREYIHNDYGY
jgi:hypothetical protein